ncbi:hypothetical protein Q0590_36830 [Rhodocytophaga aerolata]|uniref:Uncharacterized protein n=1 Tax=Rhodocytophaga aerolata TaxID=455078 RepID=A0ABT8RIG8_9BACT|nr:hypothetical protein [Rhodocytophaga aerolata]MDO1451893.1 hypothetical protein [Rhodocytophaga aerolata]
MMDSIGAIIGRNPQAVEHVLGRPGKKEAVKTPTDHKSRKYTYQNGDIEIIYIDNTADWITITNRHNKTMEEFINFFGLKELTPYFDKRGTRIYKNIAGLKEVSLYPDTKGNIWMVYIKAFTE